MKYSAFKTKIRLIGLDKFHNNLLINYLLYRLVKIQVIKV